MNLLPNDEELIAIAELCNTGNRKTWRALQEVRDQAWKSALEWAARQLEGPSPHQLTNISRWLRRAAEEAGKDA